MPALQAFGRKWRVGSDDLVFPYSCSILLRVLWFFLIGAVFLTYETSYRCHDERLLKIYLFILTALHAVALIVEVSIVAISARGTIANPYPRRNIAIPLYVLTAVFVLEFAWDIVGVIWAFDPAIDCHQSHAVLLLARGVLVWNFMVTIVIGSYMFVRIGICHCVDWCYWCYNPAKKKLHYERLNPEATYGGRRLSKASSETLAQHKRQRIWQWRLQWMFCWLRLKGEQQTAFADVATTLSDAFNHFRGYVPSDIAAGLALYAFHHEIICDTSIELRKPLDFSNEIVSKHFNRAVHYMRFAAAAYGNSVYLSHYGMIVGCIKLTRGCICCFTGCMKKKKDEGDKDSDSEFGVKTSCCGCNLAALKRTACIENEDIVYAALKSTVFCPAFFVAIDHKHQAIVVSIRGTLSIQDVITKLSAEPEIVSTSEHGDIHAHKGMLAAAHAVQLRLENDEILTRAFRAFSHYRPLIVGHSTGAGVAALLAIILKPKYPRLQCFAYSPPGCVINHDAIPYTRTFVTSVILGNDIMPRLRPESFDSLSDHVLNYLQSCKEPKYRIFLDSFFYWIGCCRPCLLKKKRMLSITQMAFKKDDLITDFDASFEEEDVYDILPDVKLLRAKDKITGKEKMDPRGKMPLFIPGRIVHISWDTPLKQCCGLLTVERLQAHWTAQSEFSAIVLDKNVIKHHLPYTVLDHLVKLQTQKNLL